MSTLTLCIGYLVSCNKVLMSNDIYAIVFFLFCFTEYEREPCVNADEGTLHAHPDDCSKFIQCISGGSGVVLTCAKNLVYDPETSSCIFPRNELICPDILPCLQKNNGYFPHPFNCSLYIQCQSGREVIQECSRGLVWDPSVNSCVFQTANSACDQPTKKR